MPRHAHSRSSGFGSIGSRRFAPSAVVAAAFLAVLAVLSPAAWAQHDPTDPVGAPGSGIRPQGGGTIICNRISVCTGRVTLVNGEAAVSSGLFWQTDFGDRKLRLFDRADNCTVLEAIDVPDGAPSENAFDGQFVYHYNFNTGQIYVYDTTTLQLVNQCDAPGNDLAEGLTFDGEYLWKGDGDFLWQFEILPNGECEVHRQLQNPPGDSADGLAYCGGLLLMLGYSGLMYQIDPVNGDIVGACRLNEGREGNGLAADGSRVAADQPTSIDLIDIDCGEMIDGARFGRATPCGEELMLTVGVPFEYPVTVIEPTDQPVTLEAIELPDGSAHAPPLPITNTPPIFTMFEWTPTNADLGRHTAFYTATIDGIVTICRVRLIVAECHLLMGRSDGADPFEVGGHVFRTQLADIFDSHPVTMEEIPAFPMPPAATSGAGGPARDRQGRAPVHVIDRFATQVVMHNPEVFPENPEQCTQGLEVTSWSDGRVSARPFGASDGMELELETFEGPDGQRYFRFPFTIEGI